MPIWDACALSKDTPIKSDFADFKDEFLVFGALYAKGATRTVTYSATRADLVILIPNLPDVVAKDSERRVRFNNFWKIQPLPKKVMGYSPTQLDAAFRVARSAAGVSPTTLTLPMMVMVLLLQEWLNYGQNCVNEIVNWVLDNEKRLALDVHASYETVLTVQYAFESTTHIMKVLDFSQEVYTPADATASLQVKYYSQCLRDLNEKLHCSQAKRIAKAFILTTPGLVIRQFLQGHADTVIKHADRQAPELQDALQRYSGCEELSKAFDALKDKAGLRMSRLSALLRQVKDQASRGDDERLIKFWAAKFEEIGSRLVLESYGVPRSMAVASAPVVGKKKRRFNAVEPPERAVEKRVKVETTETTTYTRTITKTTKYGS